MVINNAKFFATEHIQMRYKNQFVIPFVLPLKSNKEINNHWKSSIPCRNVGRWSNFQTTPTVLAVVKVTFVMTNAIATSQTVNISVFWVVLIYNLFSDVGKLLFFFFHFIYCWIKFKEIIFFLFPKMVDSLKVSFI